jgi:hypothetical protein
MLLTMQDKDTKKRAWTSAYVVLAGPLLYFFKDERDKKKVRSSLCAYITVQGKLPLTVLPIEGKTITLTADASRKGNVIQLASEFEKYVGGWSRLTSQSIAEYPR